MGGRGCARTLKRVAARARSDDNSRSSLVLLNEGRRFMRSHKWLAAAFLAVAVTPAVAGAGEPQDSRQQSLTLHFRSYYFDREKPVPPDSKASVWGGWIGYDSGWFFDRFKFALTGYTSQKIDAPLSQDGTLLLKPGQQSYSVLGEAYGSV